MGRETLTQPLLLPNQDEPTCEEIALDVNGKHLQCNGTECPWISRDTEHRSEDMKKLSRAVAFCVTFMLLEVVGGIRAGSLAILTDAAHLLSDVASFAISLFAMWAGGWEANLRQTYGFFRLEILGALVSIQIIWLITGIIVYEAFVRLLGDPVEIDGRLMFIIASLGLIVNLAMMFLLGHGHDHGHGHSHGSSNEHSHGHSHGSGNEHSHGQRNDLSITNKKEHNHSKDHGGNSSDHQHHHSGEQSHDHNSHDHHDHDEHSPLLDSHGGKHSDHHEDGHDHDHEHHLDNGTEEVRYESNDDPRLLTYTSSGMGQNAAVFLGENGHKTECVQKNIKGRRSSASGDTIIMCICDQLETQTERNDSGVKVTIDHGSNHDHHEGSSHGSSINVKGAYLHVLGDLIQSIGVMIGGAVIWYKPEWKIVDLLCTFFFSIIVLGTTIKMIRDILEVLMESTPREVDAGALQKGLMDIEGVIAVHELHIWAITVGKVVLACHVMIKPDADSDDLLTKVIQYCDQKYKISHVTIQIERLRQH